MGIFDKIKDLAKGQGDKVDAAVGKAGDMVDEKTGGKFADKVDMAEDMAKKQIMGDEADQADEAPEAE